MRFRETKLIWRFAQLMAASDPLGQELMAGVGRQRSGRFRSFQPRQADVNHGDANGNRR